MAVPLARLGEILGAGAPPAPGAVRCEASKDKDDTQKATGVGPCLLQGAHVILWLGQGFFIAAKLVEVLAVMPGARGIMLCTFRRTFTM